MCLPRNDDPRDFKPQTKEAGIEDGSTKGNDDLEGRYEQTQSHEQPKHHCLGEMYGILAISPENIAYAAVSCE